MFSIEKLKKTGEAVTSMVVSARDGVYHTSSKVADATSSAILTTVNFTNATVVQPSILALKQVWPTLEASARMECNSMVNNPNLALLRACMDGGIHPSFFFNTLDICSTSCVVPSQYVLKAKLRCSKIKVLNACKNCNNICCATYCCKDCIAKFQRIEEAFRVLTLPIARRRELCQIYFVEHALMEKKNLIYNW